MTSLQNLPIPGFAASGEWDNQWNVGTNQNVAVYFDHSGRLRLEKGEKFTLHVVLNAYSEDFEEAQYGRGVPLKVAKAYTVSLSTRNDSGVRSELVIHEFNQDGSRVSRVRVANGQRAVFVPSVPEGTLVLSLRIMGVGGISVDSIEFNPAPESSYTAAGIHELMKLDKAPVQVKRQPVDDLSLLMPIRRALYDGVHLSVLLERKDARALAGSFLAGGHLLEAKEVVRQLDLYQEVPTAALRKMFWHGRRSGYLVHALSCIDQIIIRIGSEKDRKAAERLRSEYEFHRDPWALMPELQKVECYDPQGPVLHMVGKALPERQTGYTVRTKYTVEALQKAGVKSVVAVQVGGNYDEGLPESLEHHVNGVRTVLFGGPARKDVLRDEWMNLNTLSLFELVKEIRPSIIHAHSDFTNGALATHVGEAAGVPVVYEARGFWEETWISRIGKAQGWENIDHIIRMYGAPELYELRRQSERRVRERAHRVITLAQTMKDFILEESEKDSMPAERVHLARNAVASEDFPMSTAKPAIRRSLGIADETVVVGYISSIVEYEGIEVLVEGYRLLKEKYLDARLLIVGDGPYLNKLKQHAESVGLTDAIFTGRVPHEQILEYYHSIDIFVVPRRNTRVTELVTPLKPFEAFATGCAVVVSDVLALAEIADDSGGAACVFPADDVNALAEILLELAQVPERRQAMGERGAAWVRQERSWDSNVPTYREIYRELTR